MDTRFFEHFLSPNILVAVLSLGWLFLRLRNVLKTPVDELVKVLGLEVPVPPLASLLDITSTGVTVRWHSPEQRNGALKFAVKINGMTIGELSHQENAITISGLTPGCCYTIRIVAVNQANFSAPSEPLRVRTIPDACLGHWHAIKRKRSDGIVDNSSEATAPSPLVISPYKHGSENAQPLTAPTTTTDTNNAKSQHYRVSTYRRGSPAFSTQLSTFPHVQSEQNGIAELAGALDTLRQQVQEVQAMDDDEEAEYQTLHTELVQQRDALKRQLKDRDDQNKDLNKSVKSLEHAHSAAQLKRSQQEKTLHDKIRAREKMHEDMGRWDGELDALEADSETLLRERQELRERLQNRVEEVKREQRPDSDALAAVEEQIQERGREMQELDKERKRLDAKVDQPDMSDRHQMMAVEARNWHETVANLQAQLHEANTMFLQAKFNLQQLQQFHAHAEESRMSLPNTTQNGYAQHNTPDMGVTKQETPPHSVSGARVNFDLSDSRNGPTYNHNRNATNSTTSFRTSSPFVESLPVVIPNRAENDSSSAFVDLQALTGGALASPSANLLLPSNLLGDDIDETEELVNRHSQTLPQEERGSINSRPDPGMSRPLSTNMGMDPISHTTNVDSLPGLGVLSGLGGSDLVPAPDSPAVSFGSASASAVSSPHSSIAYPHQHKLPDANADSDRHSIRSASGSSRIAPYSRKFDFFGRQRGKTMSDEGPALGSLKSHQSQSMPRESGEVSAISTSRGLFGQVIGRRLVGSNRGSNEGAAAQPNGGLNSFGPIGSGFVSSSRPTSTYSADKGLPFPSTESPRFGWAVSKENLGRPGSVRAGRIVSPWGSRRPSVQDDSSSLLARDFGDTEDDNREDDEQDKSSLPAPIGTRPPKTRSSLRSTQLNPAARDFTSVFGFGRKAEKTERGSTKNRKKERMALNESMNTDSLEDSLSLLISRKSRDTYNGSFHDSAEDIGDSAEISSSQLQDSSIQPSSNSRGSLMRRITSKGSSGKFGLTGLKDKGSLFSRRTTNVQEDGDDDSGSSKLGASVDSILSSPSSAIGPEKRSSTFSLSSLKRKSKRINDAPSVSEISMASGTGDEDDGRPSVDSIPA